MKSILILAALALSACSTTIDGRKVEGTRRVDGRTIYIAAPNDADRRAMVEGARQNTEATKDVVFGAPK